MNDYEEVNGLWLPKFVQRNGVWVKREQADAVRPREIPSRLVRTDMAGVTLEVQEIGNVFLFWGDVSGYLPFKPTEEESAVSEAERILRNG